jgi:leader peptidase (prepilin peptidase)/N-methyltransferase
MEPEALRSLADLPVLAIGWRAAAGALLGAVAGSFIATLVLRWPEGRTLAGRSACDGCGAPLGPADLLPLLSWAAARGRCRQCGARIDPLHPAVELVAALMGAAALAIAPGMTGLAGALMGWLLLALALLDQRHLWLPDRLTLPLLGLGLALGPAPLAERAAAAAIAGGALLALRLGYRALRGREGLGLGDVKLAAGIGAWLSPFLLAPFMLLAALLGLFAAALDRWRGQPRGELPFGTCLALAGWLLWQVSVAGLGPG